MNRFQRDLSQGHVARELIRFALPFLLSNIIQSLYSVADMLIVGNFSGEKSTVCLSGVNIGSQVTLIVTQIVLGLCVGGTVIIAQCVGRRDDEELKKVTSTLITSLLVLAVVVTAAMLMLRVPILRLIQTPQESFSQASDYLFVTVLGIVFIFGYNALSAILRGMGDSRSPLIFVAIAASVNVVFDLLLVAVFDMGALGAAIATVFSQALSMFLCILHLVRNGFVFDFKPASFRIDRRTLKLIMRVGLPTAVQNCLTSVSFIIITAIVNIVGGVDASAAVGVVGKYNGFAIMPAIAMGSSVSTMAAQNIGAGLWDRAKKACAIGMAVAVAISGGIFALSQLFPEQILRLFDRNEQMISFGVSYLRVFSFDYLLVPFFFCLNGLFIGAGHTMFSFATSALSSIALRAPVAALLGITLGLGLPGIAVGAPAASFCSLALCVAYYFSGRWRKNAVFTAPLEQT